MNNVMKMHFIACLPPVIIIIIVVSFAIIY